MMSARWLALLTVCCTFSALSSARADDTCHQFIETMRLHALSILNDKTASFQKKHEALSAVFDQAVDVDWVAEIVAGSYWRDASEAQRKEYLKVYRAYLSDYYIGGLDNDDFNAISSITLKSFRQRDANTYDAEEFVEQKSDEPIALELVLVEAPAGHCRVRDFTAEGVSLLISQQAEISSLGAQGGLPFITQKLASHPPIH